MQLRRLLSATVWIFLGVAAAGTAWAQSPFSGTWKLNQEKSQLTGDTIKFGPARENALELVAGGATYSFRTDGGNYAMPSGDLAIWRQTGPGGWSTEYRTRSGKLLSSDSWKVSEDGTSLTLISTGAKADGDLYTDETQYTRTDGSGQDLIGSWKSTAVKLSSPDELVIQESGLDALLLKIPGKKASCRVTLDGKEAAVQGPDISPGLRISLTRTGPYALELVEKMNGRTVSSAVYTVANDGKTMTEVGGAPGDPPATSVWEKQ